MPSACSGVVEANEAEESPIAVAELALESQEVPNLQLVRTPRDGGIRWKRRRVNALESMFTIPSITRSAAGDVASSSQAVPTPIPEDDESSDELSDTLAAAVHIPDVPMPPPLPRRLRVPRKRGPSNPP